MELWRSEGTFFIRINTPFEFHDGHKGHVFDPDVPTEVGPALSVIDTAVVSATIAVDASLAVTFDSGTAIIVRPHVKYEAWEVSGPTGERWLCVGGGEIVHWS